MLDFVLPVSTKVSKGVICACLYVWVSQLILFVMFTRIEPENYRLALLANMTVVNFLMFRFLPMCVEFGFSYAPGDKQIAK